MYSKEVIEGHERDQLLSRKMTGHSNQELAEILLPMIERKSPEKQEEFLRLVHELQPHLVEGLFEVVDGTPHAQHHPRRGEEEKGIHMMHA